MLKSDVLDIVGLCLLALFGYAIWEPICLAVFGVGALLMSWQSVQASGDDR